MLSRINAQKEPVCVRYKIINCDLLVLRSWFAASTSTVNHDHELSKESEQEEEKSTLHRWYFLSAHYCTSLCCSRRLLASSLSLRYWSSNSCSLHTCKKEAWEMPREMMLHLTGNSVCVCEACCLPQINHSRVLRVCGSYFSPISYTPATCDQQGDLISWVSHFTIVPLFHFLFHVNALFLQQLPLGKSPVHGLSRCFSAGRPLPLSPRLNGMVEPEHMALPQDDSVSWEGISKVNTNIKRAQHKCWYLDKVSHWPDLRTVGSVTLFPLTYVSAPSQGSRTTSA